MATAITERMTAHEIMAQAETKDGQVLKNLVLFFAAPWIGLGYIIAFPFIGCAVLLKLAVVRR